MNDTTTQEPPVNKAVRRALSDVGGAIETLKHETAASGLMSRVPDDFQERIRGFIRDLVDIAELGAD